MRVLEWILARCEEKLDAKEAPIGYTPYVEDFNFDGLNLNEKAVAKLLDVDVALWQKEVAEIREFYKKFGVNLPAELNNELIRLESNLRDAE